MPSLIRRAPAAPAIHPDQVLNAQIADARRPGLEAAARIQGGAFAASTGMNSAATLSSAADAAFAMSPMGERGYRRLFEAFVNLAAQEVEGLSFHDPGRF